MNDPALFGKQYISLLRCSTKGQADTSIDDQRRLVTTFATSQNMVFRDEVALEGVSGSIAANLDKVIADLVRRKKERDDFEVIVVQDLSRFSRSGATHTAKLRYDLEQVGVDIIAAVGYTPKHEFADVTDAMAANLARGHAKAIALGVARGSQSALEQGRKAHCSRCPYGLDKLYESSDGRPLYRLHTDYATGVQTRYDAASGQILDTFVLKDDTGGRLAYRKQKQEKVTLIPGKDSHVAVVHEIYRRHFVDQHGYASIARHLNMRGIAAPAGGGWNVTCVKSIIDNPIYSGHGIANHATRALYYSCAPNMPVPPKKRRRTASGRPAETRRPSDEWTIIDYPHLSKYLPEDVRGLAAEHHRCKLTSNSNEHTPKPRDKHVHSDFWLKHLLKEAHGKAMTGKRSGRYRYYGVASAYSKPTANNSICRQVRADAVEDIVLQAMHAQLVTMPTMRDDLIAIVKEAVQANANNAEREELEHEIAKSDKQLNILIDELSDDGPSFRSKIQQIRERRKEMVARLEALETPLSMTDAEIDRLVDQLIAVAMREASALRQLPAVRLRELADAIVDSVTIDLEVMHLTLVVRNPLWSQSLLAEVAAAMRLDSKLLYQRLLEAHSSDVHLQAFEFPETQWRRVA